MQAASAHDLHKKFNTSSGAFEFEFGELSQFYSGLEGLIGPPTPNIQEGMRRDHCRAEDSQREFVADNYDTTTKSEIEYHFVVDPEQVTGCHCH